MEKRDSKICNNRYGRYFWIALGLVSFALGTVGIFLPLLPTVPFYLLTLASFAKGSERLHTWFVQSSFYKNNVKDFVDTKMLTKKSKLSIIISLSLFMGIGAYFMKTPWAIAVLGVVWMVHVIYIGFIVKTKKITK